MILKSLATVSADDIRALIDNEVREGRSIEYKRELPGGTDEDKKEFLADVSSFANASGGDILYGIAASDGVPTSADGLAGMNLEATTLRLENMIRDGISPRITGLQFQTIEGFASGALLVVRVAKSWSSPHMVTFKGASRFYTRNNAGKHPMDVGEIRSAFALSEELPEKINRFRTNRIAKIVAGETPAQLADGPTLVLHVFPFVSFSPDFRLDAGAIRNTQPPFLPTTGGAFEHRFNIDGVLVDAGGASGKSGSIAYCQVFRNGVIEAVDATAASDFENRQLIPSTALEMDVIKSMGRYMTGLAALGVPAPAVLTAALLGVAGGTLAVHSRFQSFRRRTIDRDDLMFPDVLVEDFAADVGRVLRPIFDALWNAGGYERCMNYDANGNWAVSQ